MRPATTSLVKKAKISECVESFQFRLPILGKWLTAGCCALCTYTVYYECMYLSENCDTVMDL